MTTLGSLGYFSGREGDSAGGGSMFTEEQWQVYISKPECDMTECLSCEYKGERVKGHTWYSDDPDKMHHREDTFREEFRIYCFTCAYWMDMWQTDCEAGGGLVIVRDDLEPVTVNGEQEPLRWHYSYNPQEPMSNRQFRGLGGQMFKIELFDDDVNYVTVETNNLWSQSEIPTWFYDKFPVNARFKTTLKGWKGTMDHEL